MFCCGEQDSSLIGYHRREKDALAWGTGGRREYQKRERRGDDVRPLAFSAPAVFIWTVVTFYPTALDFSEPRAYHINVL